MNPYLVSFHVAWILSKTNRVEIKTGNGHLGGGVGWWLPHHTAIVCIYNVCGRGVREKITERLIAGTLEARHHLQLIVYYLRQRVGSRNADRHIPRDKLTHIHNRAKKGQYSKQGTTLHYMYIKTVPVQESDEMTNYY